MNWRIVSVAVLCAPLLLTAQNKDTRNVLLNAETASVPREINIGLPGSGNGAGVYVDGLKHAQGLPRGHYHWAGGNAYEPVGTIGLMEASVRAGEIGVLVDSRTRLGRDTLSGAFTVASSSNGLIRFDGAVNGPIRKGWYFAAGAYVNYDPTSVNAPSRPFVDQKQIYQAALTWRGVRMTLTALYRFSLCRDRVDGGYSAAPFVYEGDGTISKLDGFRLGRDCYMPADERVSWMDIATGTMREGDMSRLDRRFLHDASVHFDYRTRTFWDLSAAFHLCYMQPSTFLKVTLAGIDAVSPAHGYSLPDGTVFGGRIQRRLVTVYDTHTTDAELLLKAERRWKRNSLNAGLSLVSAGQYEAGSSFQFAHTVTASPQRILRGGADTWQFNRSGSYMDARKVAGAFYVLDDWYPVDRLLLRTGIRLKPLHNNVWSAVRLDGETVNTRVEGFNLADLTLSSLHHFSKIGLDYVFSEHMSVRLIDRFFAMAEGFYSKTSKATTYYKNATLPSLKAIGNALVRGGLTYDGPWADVTLLASYITSWNNAAPVSVTKQVGGESETILWTAQYGIGTFGVTLDGNLHFGGFRMHMLATWQNPRYKNYDNSFRFSDGSVTEIDYTGNCVTGISRLLLEVDPSYRWKQYRVWASIRYNSRQYVSRTNLAWFAGRFETFAGAEAGFGKHHKVSLNLVNLLFQRGAKGSIDIADTIEDMAALEGLVMSGSYLRPFTAELSYTYSF